MTRSEGKAEVEWSLAELAEETGCPPRTIRFYIAKGLLRGPTKAGRGASYGQEHVCRINEIRNWQDKGLTLTEIVRKLAGDEPSKIIEVPTAWWSYQLQSDVTVQVRADASPWRLRQIQRALKDLSNRLTQPTTKENRNDDKQ
jgi:DNA-binding transcriptional MerR regulator